MAHKTLVDGTAYEIDGGTDLIDGTVYEKDYGDALVDGTAYEVGFAPAEAIVTVSGYGYGFSSVCASIEIDGETHWDAANGLEFVLPTGTVIKCTAYYGKSLGGTITLNGVVVASTTIATTPATYEYTVAGNVHIALSAGAAGPSGPGYGSVTITEE